MREKILRPTQLFQNCTTELLGCKSLVQIAIFEFSEKTPGRTKLAFLQNVDIAGTLNVQGVRFSLYWQSIFLY